MKIQWTMYIMFICSMLMHMDTLASAHVSVLTWETFAAPSIYRCVLACNSVRGGGLSTLATGLVRI